MGVSIRDVAKAASVSVGTVSNVINRPERVTPKTAASVNAAILRLGFVRNDAARQLRVGRSRSIGLIVLDVRNPFFTDVTRGAENRAAQDKMTVLLGNSDENNLRENALLELFEEQRVNGILISPLSNDLQQLRSIQMRGTPIVLVDREAKSGQFSSVSVDDVAGGFTAIKHLIEIGRKKLVFIGGPLNLRQVADRLEGARQAVALSPGVTLEVLPTNSLTVLQGRLAGENITARRARERPDGVFAANDLLAVGVLQALTLLGSISIPKEIVLIGYDDIDFAQSTVVPLSSIRQPAELIGKRAIELLMQELASPGNFEFEQVIFQPELVTRASTQL